MAAPTVRRRRVAEDYRSLRAQLPSLRVFGGCCGTDHRHIAAISTALAPAADATG